ncbi:MAG: ribonuclease HI [Aggregatilineales bacterium]
MLTDRIIIYTDGSAAPNPGPGGYAALLLFPDGQEEVLSGSQRYTTNNIMELTAAISALERLDPALPVEIVTDSEYLKKGITEWLPNWEKRNWKTAAGKPVLNRELWMRLRELTRNRDIQWRWTRAHTGVDTHNERVDRIANQARQLARHID